MITTRKATNEDRDFLWSLKVASMRTYVEQVYGWDDTVQQMFFDDGFCPENLDIIQYEGQEVGMYELRNREEDWFLARIEIRPEFQNRGIGRTVLQKIVDHVTPTGRPLRLQVFKVNPARGLYEHMGFHMTGETDKHIQMELPNKRMQRTPEGAADA